ncbi:hypothetical protein FGLOB1_9925 [Fusarium globosum]|uniref:CENP-V/GFA domain-containing protein n=1 Tax=Fusarium globosum TaxID=78864 RepID=A0A8H5XX78_9HYPO|nr:hypothetical protein FGLOB1_9925 [Fusarium globosum]
MYLSLPEIPSTNSEALLSAARSIWVQVLVRDRTLPTHRQLFLGSGPRLGLTLFDSEVIRKGSRNYLFRGSCIGKFIAQDVKVSTTADDAIAKYSLSDTSSGSSKEKAFCRTCGCTLWTIPAAAKGKFYMIRLPLLDQGLNFQPANEIFIRNRPTWVEPVKDAGQWHEMRK